MISRMVIDNMPCGDSAGHEFCDLVNPATEERFAVVPVATPADVEDSISSAKRAFLAWSELGSFQRGTVLRKASEIVYERRKEIGTLITTEMGKALPDAVGEVEKAAVALRYYAEEGERIQGRIVANDDPDCESYVRYEPAGVVAAIVPWNYPIEQLCWKMAASLAAGCTIVAKPSSITPLCSVAFLQCLVDAGLPPGVANMVFGAGQKVGELLVTNPGVRKVAFTGSTAVGRRILGLCRDSMTKVSAELGGQCPLIVCKTSRLDLAVQDAVRRSFRNNGQVCIAINRIYVHKDVYAQFLEKLISATARLKVGDSLRDPGCNLGPMATRAGREKVKLHIDDALLKGARLVQGGNVPANLARGYFFMPTILAEANQTMKVMTEESFGPIVGIMPFQTNEEALALANSTSYGLASYVHTTDVFEAEYFARYLECGNVAINNPDAGVMNAPYGGWKDSGDGYEHGPEGMFSYLRTKHVRKRIRLQSSNTI